MTTAPPPPNPIALLKQAGLIAKPSWGQNFLLDQSILAETARLAVGEPPATVLELGAGLGALTYHLLVAGARVIAIERDREIAPLLRQALAWSAQLEVVEADAVRLDYGVYAARSGGPLAVAGNLPYQLSSRILVSIAEAREYVARAVVLLQLEVAERLVAAPGGRDYGLLSVLVQRSFAVHIARHVPPGAFHPRPKVQSAVVVLERESVGREVSADRALVAAARAAFHGRRKMLRNSLATALDCANVTVDAAIHAAGLSPQTRAETLSIDDFARLGAALLDAGLLSRACEGPVAD